MLLLKEVAKVYRLSWLTISYLLVAYIIPNQKSPLLQNTAVFVDPSVHVALLIMLLSSVVSYRTDFLSPFL
jgi:hypothetical protein